ncbi:putative DNA-directed RNA polymerase subunit [Tupanvirus soda lake]|uniref:DNA-directed RNA polymerase subunit n=2 Tax=Tupanvirus TaxID=2094720 RepID=A0AC62ABN8_9VIRU|nr:putative DNA-directed RNA polymerase subunit [Tupanvirus soda lake]QKU35200.1 putative DNA-directed RNA polymerase subunit [Tupanvirus soda lake]
MAQISLYYRTQLDTKVSLFPEQIDGNMDDHILENLKAKIEGKSIDNGIVLRINRLISYDYGMIDKANFMGTTVFPVKYECFVCSPTKDLEIVCVLENIVKGFLIAKNGPVIIAIQFNNIDTQKFEISGNNILYTKTKKPVEKGDYLKVSIININNNLGEKNIVTMCKLLNLANKDEIQSYEQDQLLITNGSEDDNKEFI